MTAIEKRKLAVEERIINVGPLVSVCLPTLNARRFLEPRMATILTQTLTDWELIVCDSFSDDGTWEYIQQFRYDPRVRLYQVPKEGLYAGWNECLRRCRGEYVYIATADDTCSPDLLEKMVGALGKAESRKQKAENKTIDCRLQTADFLGGEATGSDDAEQGLRSAVCGLQSDTTSLRSVVCGLQSAPQGLESKVYGLKYSLPADIAVCHYDEIDENGSRIAREPREVETFLGDWFCTESIRNGLAEFLIHIGAGGSTWVTMTAVIFRRSLLETIGMFNTKMWMLGDAEWAYRASLASDIVVVPEKLATWRRHDRQVTGASYDYQRLFAKWSYKAATVVTRDRHSGIPLEWNRVPGWRSLLEKKSRLRYWDSLGLYRWVLKHRPRQFVRGLVDASISAPTWLLMQTKNRFRENSDLLFDTQEHLHHLFKTFSPPWPPKL